MALALLPVDAAPLELRHETGAPGDARLLTIVVASYNHRRYLAEAFNAIEGSAVCDRLAVIFIDDGSTDDTVPFVTGYSFDPALHMRVYSKPNAGLCDSLASGLALTQTPFVAFIASDDRYEPQGLDTVVDRLATSKTNDLCWICQATYLEGRDGEPVYGKTLSAIIDAPPDRRARALSVEFPKPLLLQSTVFGTAMLRDAGAWRDGLVLDDWPTFIKVAQLAAYRHIDMRAMLDVVLCRYRVHPGGAHNNLVRQLSICTEVAEHVVAPEYRREAIANVYADIALIQAYERNFGSAARLFANALINRPHPETLARPLKRVMAAISQRLLKHVKR